MARGPCKLLSKLCSKAHCVQKPRTSSAAYFMTAVNGACSGTLNLRQDTKCKCFDWLSFAAIRHSHSVGKLRIRCQRYFERNLGPAGRYQLLTSTCNMTMHPNANLHGSPSFKIALTINGCRCRSCVVTMGCYTLLTSLSHTLQTELRCRFGFSAPEITKN